MQDVKQARLYLNSVVIDSPALSKVHITALTNEKVRATWFVPKNAQPRTTLLYFHGGGYSFDPKSHANLIAWITLAAQTKTLSVDYRLAPEHRFPAQLEDALDAYRWLLESGTDPNEIVVGGDSAGGNLTLALLLSLRDAKLPLPTLGIGLSPATDFVVPTEFGGRASLVANEEFDYVSREMLIEWSGWFCGPEQRRNPLVSPIYADLRGLPPIYIQAGRAEVLYDSIQAFADRAKMQGADVVLESWDDMNHEFELFGRLAPQSVEALQRIGDVIRERVRAGQTPAI